MNKAFVLGAGLGTRLKKLTENIPKPMIPVFGKPLIEFAFDHLIDAGFGQFMWTNIHLALLTQGTPLVRTPTIGA